METLPQVLLYLLLHRLRLYVSLEVGEFRYYPGTDLVHLPLYLPGRLLLEHLLLDCFRLPQLPLVYGRYEGPALWRYGQQRQRQEKTVEPQGKQSRDAKPLPNELCDTGQADHSACQKAHERAAADHTSQEPGPEGVPIQIEAGRHRDRPSAVGQEQQPEVGCDQEVLAHGEHLGETDKQDRVGPGPVQ